jgi:periplasmic protein CpxP/Spy
MKKLLMLSLAALSFSFVASAQTDRAMDTTKKEHKGKGHGKHMKKDLNLTPEQQAKLKALREENKGKQVKDKAATQAKIQEILTPEQIAKMEEIKKLKKEKKINARKKGKKSKKSDDDQKVEVKEVAAPASPNP